MSGDVLVNGFAVSPSADGGAAVTMRSASGESLSTLLTAEDRTALALALLGEVRGYVVVTLGGRDEFRIRDGLLYDSRVEAAGSALFYMASGEAEATACVVTALPSTTQPRSDP